MSKGDGLNCRLLARNRAAPLWSMMGVVGARIACWEVLGVRVGQGLFSRCALPTLSGMSVSGISAPCRVGGTEECEFPSSTGAVWWLQLQDPTVRSRARSAGELPLAYRIHPLPGSARPQVQESWGSKTVRVSRERR